MSIGNNADGVSPTSTACTLTAELKLSDTANVSKIKFGVRATAANAVEYDTNDYDSLVTDTAKSGALVCTPLELAVTAPSSDTSVSQVNVGSGSATNGVSVSEAMTWENNAAKLDNFRVKVTTTDPNATYQVVVGDASKLPADNTTGALKSGQESGNLNIGANNTTGIATLTMRVIAPDKTATKNYTLTVTSTYVAINRLTVTTQRPGGAVTVPKNGLEGNFDAAKNAYTIYVPSDVPENSGVQIVPTNAGGYGIKDSIAVTSNNCTAATSITSGGTLAVTNIKNNATVQLTSTAADNKTTKIYTFTFKTVNIDTSIASFTMTGQKDGATYNSDSTKASADYFFSLPSSTGFKGFFKIATTVATSSVTIGGKAYSATTEIGPGSYTVTVTAEAGNTKNYSVIVENKYDAAKFEALSVSIGGGNYEDVLASGSAGEWSGLDTSSAVYTREVPVNSNTEFKIKGTVSAGASVTVGNGLSQPAAGSEQVLTGNLLHGKNEFRVSLSTDEGTKDYTFVINVLEKKNTVTGITLTNNNTAIGNFTFNAGTKEYNVEVPYSIANARITVTTDGTYTRVFAENGDMFTSDAAKRAHSTTFTFKLPDPTATVNTIKFRAVSDLNLTGLSEAGDWYTITVTRGEANTDATLKKLSITINGEKREIPLEDNVWTYTIDLIELGIDIVSVKGSIDAEATASTSTISGKGEIEFNFDGDIATNTFPVKVTAEDGSTKTYVIAVARNGVNFNKDDTVSKVTILGNDAKEYYNGTPAYGDTVEISVPFGVERISLTAIPGHSTATIVGGGSIELAKEAGVAKEIKVYAIAESGDNSDGAKAIIFKITREEQRSSGLANITIDGTQVSGFDKDKTIYKHQVVSTTGAIALRAIAENENATVEIDASNESALIARDKGEASGTIAFKAAAGESDTVTVTIRVEIDNKPITYVVTVTRASSSPQLVSLRVGNYTLYDENGNMIGNDDADALNKAKKFYVNLDINLGLKLDITARASDDLATLKLADKPDKFTGSFTYENFDLTDKLENSATTDVPLLVMAAGGEGSYISYQIIFTLLTSDTSADIVIYKNTNGTDPLADFNSEYAVDPSAPVYGPYPVDQATLEFKIQLSDKGGAVGSYQVRRRNNKGEDVLMIDNGTAVGGGIRLAYGTNVFCVNITSSDKKAERTVVILAERGGVGAKNISVNGSEDFKFDAGSTSFICSVGNTVTSLKDQISVTLNNDDLDYELVGAENNLVEGGFTQIKINIYEKTSGASATADKEPLKTLYINVFRQGVATVVEQGETPLWQIILFWALVALVVIELIIIIAVPKRKKSAQQVVVAATPTVAYVPPVQTVQPVQPVQPQAPQTPAAPPPQAPTPPPAPQRPAEPSRSQNAKPFVSPDNSGYYDGGSSGYYGNGGYGSGGYGSGGYGSGSYGNGGYGGYGSGYDDNDKY